MFSYKPQRQNICEKCHPRPQQSTKFPGRGKSKRTREETKKTTFRAYTYQPCTNKKNNLRELANSKKEQQCDTEFKEKYKSTNNHISTTDGNSENKPSNGELLKTTFLRIRIQVRVSQYWPKMRPLSVLTGSAILLNSAAACCDPVRVTESSSVGTSNSTSSKSARRLRSCHRGRCCRCSNQVAVPGTVSGPAANASPVSMRAALTLPTTTESGPSGQEYSRHTA